MNSAGIGITRSGLNTKIYALCDALGNPLRFLLTPGQRHDSKAVPELLDGVVAKALLADKVYDSDKIIQSVQEKGMQAIIPSKANRKYNAP
jgi:transposase